MRKAVVDVGSNSVLLLVAERTADSTWAPLKETSVVTGLGRGTKTTGLLSEPGMAATLAALRNAFDCAIKYNCEHTVAAATMAARIATNTPDFLQRAAAQGTPVTVLSGDEEARLGLQAVVSDPHFRDAPVLSVIDVGGHSTELVTAARNGQGWAEQLRRSFPIGALGLREGSLQSERADAQPLLAAVCEIDTVIGLRYLPGTAGQAVTLGATGTNLVTIREKLPAWDAAAVHGAGLDYEEVSKAAGWLAGMTDSERAKVPGIEPGREHTLHAGALILERVLFALGVLGCNVSVRGWRHALLEELES